jgi:predicted CopG family antitoxin
MLYIVDNKKLQNIGKYNYKTIAVSHTNYSILKDLGKAGDSFNDVLSKVLKSAVITKKEDTN